MSKNEELNDSKQTFFISKVSMAEEMVQQRTVDGFAEEWSSVLTATYTAHNHVQLQI